jgi:hypothetical protein
MGSDYRKVHITALILTIAYMVDFRKMRSIIRANFDGRSICGKTGLKGIGEDC